MIWQCAHIKPDGTKCPYVNKDKYEITGRHARIKHPEDEINEPGSSASSRSPRMWG